MLGQYKKNLLHRLKIIQGHLNKVLSMVEDERYCLDIIQQSQAIENSLKKVDEILLENHLKTCVREAIAAKKGVDEKVDEVVKVFRANK